MAIRERQSLQFVKFDSKQEQFYWRADKLSEILSAESWRLSHPNITCSQQSGLSKTDEIVKALQSKTLSS